MKTGVQPGWAPVLFLRALCALGRVENHFGGVLGPVAGGVLVAVVLVPAVLLLVLRAVWLSFTAAGFVVPVPPSPVATLGDVMSPLSRPQPAATKAAPMASKPNVFFMIHSQSSPRAIGCGLANFPKGKTAV